MTSENRESRFEELRRKARERLEQVREGIERERGTSAPKSETPTPDRLEDIYNPPERERPPEVVAEPEPVYQENNRGVDAWEQRVVVPSHTESAPAFETPRIGPTISTTPAFAASAVNQAQQLSTGRTHRSPAAQLLRKGNLRQAIVAQEVLGKPLSMRPPPDEE